MSIQSDRWISEEAVQRRMIEPFSGKQADTGAVSGFSSYGYNLRAPGEFRVFSKGNGINTIWPVSAEYFCIPRDVLTICVGKSAYARCGIASERGAIRAGAGEFCCAGNLQHNAATGQGQH